MTAALEVVGLSVAYGGVRAVRGVSLQIQPGELVALIGSNGAGKTSSLLGIMGLITAHQSSLKLFGTEISSLPAHRRVRAGMTLVPEGRGILTRMSVTENLQVGLAAAGAATHDGQGAFEEVYEFFPRLRERANQLAGTLSGGEQQMLALARAMLSRPRVLLLDEPSMGLSPAMVDVIFDVVKTISEQGTTILLVEQNAALALEIADRGYVMDSGVVTLYGQAQALAQDARVRAAYLGE